MNIALWLGGSSVVATLVILLIKRFIKDIVLPRFGDLGVLVVLYAISLIIAVGGWLINILPEQFIKIAAEIFGISVLIYQVLIKAIVQKAIMGQLDPDETKNKMSKKIKG